MLQGDDQNTSQTLSGFCTIHLRIFPKSVFFKYCDEILRSAATVLLCKQKYLKHASRLWHGVKLLNVPRLPRRQPLWDSGNFSNCCVLRLALGYF